MKKIFLSYCWANEKEADEIDLFFSNRNINLIRDKKDLEYTENINEFMKKISESDFFMLVLSEQYFKSKNCMNELFEALKEKEFKEKVLPIVIENGFYSNEIVINTLKHWENQELLEKNKLEGLDPVLSSRLYEEVNKILKIKINIVENMVLLQGMLLTTLEKERREGFKTILNKIGNIEIHSEKSSYDNLFCNIKIPNLKEITNNDKEQFMRENFAKMIEVFDKTFFKIKEKNSNFDYYIESKNDLKIIEIKVNNESLKKMMFWLGGFVSFNDKQDEILYRVLNKYDSNMNKNTVNGMIKCEVNSVTKELEVKESMGLFGNLNGSKIEDISMGIIQQYFLNELEMYSNRVRK